MSDAFCSKERVECLPINIYYGWKDSDLATARLEVDLTEGYKSTGRLSATTPYIEAILWSDLVIDFSGDIWGDNANFLGNNRFLVGLLKDKTAQNLAKTVVMLAGSPGPFTDEKTREIAKEVYAGFELVTNREPLSTQLLKAEGFDISRTVDLACPAFLFEAAPDFDLEKALTQEGVLADTGADTANVGFILCGWNFNKGPFDKWPRSEDEYELFVQLIEELTEKLPARICLMSHSNGFDVPPAPFKLKHGRDYAIVRQLEKILKSRAKCDDFVTLNGIYSPAQTKSIIGSFDMLISGCIHAAVSALSQGVPTVILDYGHEPKAHKLRGFARVAGVEDYIVDPSDFESMLRTVHKCWLERKSISQKLKTRLPSVESAARKNFQLLADLID